MSNNSLYIKHKFGRLHFQERFDEFKKYFNLESVGDNYYKSGSMIIKLDRKMLVVIISENWSKHKKELNDYFLK